jgi:hypothetical protein
MKNGPIPVSTPEGEPFVSVSCVDLDRLTSANLVYWCRHHKAWHTNQPETVKGALANYRKYERN